jgi:shikimate kinase
VETGIQGDGRMKKQMIYLIGFMGSGKSTIARRLADQLKIPKLEMDDILAEQFGKPITKIFEEEGEEAFRQSETALIQKIGQRGPAVVSCGGGIVMREENVRYMKERGSIVLLQAEPATIYERVKNSTNRPLLNGHMSEEYISDLMNQRSACYEAAADYTVQVDGKNPHQVAAEIIRFVDAISL